MCQYWFGSFSMFPGMIFPIIIIAAIVYLVVRGGRGCGGHGNPSQPEENALEILKRRYAKGEITSEEFERMKREIR